MRVFVEFAIAQRWSHDGSEGSAGAQCDGRRRSGMRRLLRWSSGRRRCSRGMRRSCARSTARTPRRGSSCRSGETNAETDIAFWTGLKARRMKIEIAQVDSPQPGVQQVAFEAEIISAAQSKLQTVYVIDGQLWQKQSDQWRIVATQRSALSAPAAAALIPEEHLRPGTECARRNCAGAEAGVAAAQARAGGLRSQLVLRLSCARSGVSSSRRGGGADAELRSGARGRWSSTTRTWTSCSNIQVPKARGIPAIAVLDANGKLLYSQKGGEFEKARSLARRMWWRSE